MRIGAHRGIHRGGHEHPEDVDDEAPADAHLRDQQPGQGRPDEEPGVQAEGRQRIGLRQLIVPNCPGQQRFS